MKKASLSSLICSLNDDFKEDFDMGNEFKRLPQELLAEDLWLLWDVSYGVLPLNKISELLQKK